MRERGWAKVECLGFWESLLAGARHPSLVLPGDDPLEQEARQLASAPVSVPAPLRVWLHQPWAIGTCVPLALDSAAIALARFGSGAIEAHEASSEGPHRFWASLSQDPHSRERKRIKRVLGAAHGSWEIIVLDSPRQLSLRQWAGGIRPERAIWDLCQPASETLRFGGLPPSLH